MPKLLQTIFPPKKAMSYHFKNLFESQKEKILFDLEYIEKIYEEYKSALKEMNKLDSYSKELKTFFHALSSFKEYLNGNNRNIEEMDAEIYREYIKQRHSYFVKTAKKIDKEMYS